MEDFLKIMVPDDDCNPISTLVFMDLEATGLPSHIGKKNVHITEISLVAIDRTDFECDRSLRVLNKLSLCIRPRTTISPGAMTITGLYNDVLENQGKFDETVPKMMEYFFRRLRRPLCLLAHNGQKYDFPLLQAELKHINYALDPEILCADTLEAFRFIVANQNTICDTIPTGLQKIESTKSKDPDDWCLDEETDHLLSKDIGIFLDVKEPNEVGNSYRMNSKLHITEPNKDAVLPNDYFQTKLDPQIDEKTPPKSKISNLAAQPLKKIKLDLVNQNKFAVNLTKLNQPQAKRQLFMNGESSNNTSFSKAARPSKPKQFSLEKLYYHYFGENPPISHYAEADCIALSKVCQIVNQDMLKWVDENSRSFSDVKAMW